MCSSAADGGAFNYGTQGFFGSVPGSLAPGQHLVAPIVGIAVTHSGKGYWFVGADGGVFNYGDAPFLGSIYTAIGNHPLNGPIVGIQHLGGARLAPGGGDPRSGPREAIRVRSGGCPRAWRARR